MKILCRVFANTFQVKPMPTVMMMHIQQPLLLIFFDDIIYTSRITRQLLIRLMYEPWTNTYEWQAYMPLKHVNQNKCFRDRNNMIKELVVVLNGLGFLTPPRKMW